MLWFIPTLPFHLPRPPRKKHRLARPIKISAPIRRPSGSMHLSSFGESPREGVTVGSSSGTFNHKPGNTKPGVRRRPLLSVNPLPDISESAPQASTSKAAQVAQPTVKKRPSLVIRTTTALPEHNHVHATRQTSPKPRFDPMKPFRTSVHNSRATENEIPETNPRWKGKEREVVMEEEDEARENRIAAKAKEIRRWLRGKSGLAIHQPTSDFGPKRKNLNVEPSYADKTRQTVNGIHDIFKKKPADRGPKAGQNYEIVQMRIVENNPEKTVEISTWREQAARKENGKEDDDRMSVYFIGPDQYPQEGEFATEMSPLVEWRAEQLEVPAPPAPVAGFPPRKPSTRKGSPKIERRETGKSHARRPQQENDTSTSIPSKEKSISASTSEKDTASPSVTKGPSNNESPFADHGIVPGSSTPKEHQGPTPRTMQHKTQDNGHKKGSGHRKDSKRVEKDLPQAPVPFRPTQSRGSTISSIKSESTTEFEAVLRSCEPSLLHIAPILRSLGIRRIEHLRAVAKLRPTTRDREVKEDALKMGITVMEWAIFVDRMFAL